jgi:hypothetical protein
MNFKNNFMFKSNGSGNGSHHHHHGDSTHSKFTRKYQLPITTHHIVSSHTNHHGPIATTTTATTLAMPYQTKDAGFYPAKAASTFNNNYG